MLAVGGGCWLKVGTVRTRGSRPAPPLPVGTAAGSPSSHPCSCSRPGPHDLVAGSGLSALALWVGSGLLSWHVRPMSALFPASSPTAPMELCNWDALPKCVLGFPWLAGHAGPQWHPFLEKLSLSKHTQDVTTCTQKTGRKPAYAFTASWTCPPC